MIALAPGLYIPHDKKDSFEFDRFLDETYRSIKITTDNLIAEELATQATVAAMQSPAICSLHLNGIDQAIAVNVVTTLPMVRAFDTHSYWDVLSGRYMPLEEGYYNVSLHVTFEYLTSGLIAAGNLRANIIKNGANEAICRIDTDSATAIRRSLATSKVVYMNGSTDYLSFAVVYDAGTALTVLGSSNRTFASINYLGRPTVA